MDKKPKQRGVLDMRVGKRLKVEVYWNLHKKIWSVRDCKTGLVVAHVPYIFLTDVKWVVRPAGNAKVRREGKKNVHAFARGQTMVGWSHNHDFHEWSYPITYNPYKNTSFVRVDTGEEVNYTVQAVLAIGPDGKPMCEGA